jgi:hypothetical protein
VTCANCGGDAVYVFADPGALPIAYCDADLPEFLRTRADLDNLPVVSSVVLVAAPDPLADVPRPRSARNA